MKEDVRKDPLSLSLIEWDLTSFDSVRKYCKIYDDDDDDDDDEEEERFDVLLCNAEFVCSPTECTEKMLLTVLIQLSDYLRYFFLKNFFLKSAKKMGGKSTVNVLSGFHQGLH